jgi:hypothetical protein
MSEQNERKALGSRCTGFARWSIWAAAIVIAVASYSCAPSASASAERNASSSRARSYQLASVDSSARPSGQEGRMRFSLRGNNGYRIVVTSVNGRASLAASRGHAAAIYISARAKVDRRELTAKFGHLGVVSVRFHPSGRLRTRDAPETSSGCSVTPRKVVDQLGTFAGEIRFRGEEGFAEVAASHATGTAGPIQHQSCKRRTRASKSQLAGARVTRHVRPRLRAIAPVGRDLLDFRAGRGAISSLGALTSAVDLSAGDLPEGGIPFSVVSIERKQAMQIARVVIAKGGVSSFQPGERMTAATVSPPLPFSGVGHFRLCPARAWSGSLSVSLPGKRNEALTGKRFLLGVELEPEGECQSVP